jgi:hypothetical protein
MRAFTIPLSFAALAILGACSGSNGASATLEVGSTSSALSGPPVQADPSAAPYVEVTVTEISAHVAGGDDGDGEGKASPKPPGPEIEDAPSGDGWVIVFEGRETIRLGDRTDLEALLGAGPIPAGKVTQIRLVIADATLVSGATRTPLACSSCGQTGLKIVTRGKVSVPVGGTYHVTLDFDLDTSLHADGDGWRIEPTIKVDGEGLR